MLLIRRQPRGSLRFQSSNSSVPLHSWNRMAKLSLPRKPCIARCDIDLRGNGWRGATITCLAWQQWNVAGKSVSAGSSAASRVRRLFSFADTLLVRLEQHVSTFPLRWRRCSFVAFDFWRRSRGSPCLAVYLLPVTHHWWTSVFQLSMGCSPAGGRLFVDLSCAMAPVAAGPFVAAGTVRLGAATARQGDPDYSNNASYGVSRLTCGFVSAQVPSLQIDAYVRRREANKRR